VNLNVCEELEVERRKMSILKFTEED